MKAALHNLGCKVNAYETEVMEQSLREHGYEIVPFDEKADVYIVNTCTVTNIADRKSRQMLHRARQQNPDAVVAAAGCYAQTAREALEKEGSVDLIVGNNRKREIAGLLEAYLRQREALRQNPENCGGEALRQSQKDPGGEALRQRPEILCAVSDISAVREYEEVQLRKPGQHTRAYIKIQDGCNQFCSYCAIPYARGRVRSRRAEDVLREAAALAGAGCREVVLTGIHVSSYGIDFDGDAWEEGRSERRFRGGQAQYGGISRLIDLTERLQEIPGVERIRLGSLEPRIITEETAARLSAIPKLCPHFHLSLQSGCDTVLKRMNRHYTTGEYYQSVETLRKFFGHPAITTDVIVGFPGETEEEFAQTREFLEKVCFYEMHIFKYSRRDQTPAAGMPDQVPEQVKARRSGELLALEGRQSKAFRGHYIGREAEVLLEETRELEGRLYEIGHTKDYVKVAVEVKRGAQEKSGVNMLVKVPVRGFLTDEILS